MPSAVALVFIGPYLVGATGALPPWSLEALTFPPGSLASRWTLLWFLGFSVGGFLFWAAPFFGFSPAVAPSLCLPTPWVLFLLAFGSTLSRSFCGYLWSSWAPFRILVLHFGLVPPLGSLSLVPPLPFWAPFSG